MATLGQMVDRIKEDFPRDEITGNSGSFIERYLRQAVQFYQNRRFWFNELEFSMSLSSGAQFVKADDTNGLPLEIDEAWFVLDGARYELEQGHLGTVSHDNDYSISNQGTPEQFFWFNGQLGVAPRPDQTLVIRARGLVSPTTLSVSTDSNVFSNNADSLLVYHAMAEMAAVKFQDLEMAQTFRGMAQLHLGELATATVHRNSTGRLKRG